MPPDLFDPEAEMNSIVRPADQEYDFNFSPGRNNALLRESSAETKHNENAMNYLREALAHSKEVTPGQGFAAALLAAIPAIGGGLIGRSFGPPKVAPGVWGVDLKPQGEGVGGLIGLAGGQNAAQGYLKSLDTQEIDRPVYEKMAAIESRQADNSAQAANQLLASGLNNQDEIGQIGLREASQIRVQNASNNNIMARQEQHDRRMRELNELPAGSPLRAKALEVLGLPPETEGTTAQLNTFNNILAENRRQEGQDKRLSGENLMPPSGETKKKMDSVIATKTIGTRYINKLEAIAQQDPGYLERNIEVALPATELGQLQKDLGLFSVQIRNAREAGVMTDKDELRYNSYLRIGKLDTVKSVLGRMKELQAVTDLSAQATLSSAKLGNENVSKYEKFLGFTVPKTFAIPNSQTEIQKALARFEELTKKAAE